MFLSDVLRRSVSPIRAAAEAETAIGRRETTSWTEESKYDPVKITNAISVSGGDIISPTNSCITNCQFPYVVNNNKRYSLLKYVL